MTRSKVSWRNVLVLAVAGGLAFWLANFAISRTPVAAEYRAILSISYYPMLLESLIGGLITGFCLSYLLLRFHDRIPAKNPIAKSLWVSFIVLIITTILVQGPSSFLATTNEALRSFLLGALFNAVRIPALGIAIGYVYMKLNGKA